MSYLKVILGILNSSFATYFITKIAFDLTQGAFTKVRTNQLGLLPIPSFNKQERIIESMVDEIMKMNSWNLDSSVLKTQIDQLVYGLYGLTEDEIKIVDGERGNL